MRSDAGGGENDNFELTGAQQRVALVTLVAQVDVVLNTHFPVQMPLLALEHK